MAKKRASPPPEAPPQSPSKTITTVAVLLWTSIALYVNLPMWAGALRIGAAIAEVSRAFHVPPAGWLLSSAWLAAFILSAAVLGRLSLRALKVDAPTRRENLVFSLGLGLGVCCLAALGLGLSGAFKGSFLRWGLIGPAVVAFASTALFNEKDSKGVIPQLGTVPSRWITPAETKPASLIFLGLAALMLINLLGAMGPEVFYDSLTYHLALPKLYLLNGRMIPTPYNVYSGFPLNVEMLYGIGLALGGEGTARLVPFALGVLCLGPLYVLARRYTDRTSACFAALLFYSSPAVAMQSWHSMADLAVCLFGLLAVSALLLEPNPGTPTRRRIALAGIFAGLCLGAKYNAFPIPLILATLIIAKGVKEKSAPSRIIGDLALLAGVTALVFAPWLLKNFLFYRNPVFPFFNDRFAQAPRTVDWRALVADAHARDLKATFTSFGRILGLFELLAPRFPVAVDSDFLGIAFYLMLPVVLVRSWLDAARRELLLACAVAFVAWAFHTSMPRFFLFALPYFAILAAATIAAEKGMTRKFLLACAVFAAAVNGAFDFLVWQGEGAWRVAAGGMPKDDFLSRTQPLYPTPSYAGVKFINEHAPPGSKILFVHEARAFYCDRPFIAASLFAENPLVAQANRAKNAEDLLARVRALGATHILFNRAEMTRLGADSGLSKEGAAVLDSFWKKDLTLLFEDKHYVPGQQFDWVQVFSLKPGP